MGCFDICSLHRYGIAKYTIKTIEARYPQDSIGSILYAVIIVTYILVIDI